MNVNLLNLWVDEYLVVRSTVMMNSSIHLAAQVSLDDLIDPIGTYLFCLFHSLEKISKSTCYKNDNSSEFITF